ncbi:MAG: caspase family protein [Muribaculaceae bacterium]|nr:caspase family protein [Muribaculaceae bacterium]MDE6792345.1 caspase family protein [Muribaculaceae bacterium]
MTNKLVLFLTTLLLSFSCYAKGKEALLIGIGKYDTKATGWGKMHGDSDVALLSPLLRKQGFSVSKLVNKEATKENIVNSIKELTLRVNRGDRIFILFSLHGQLTEDCNGDESRPFDEALVPYDALRSEGYAAVPKIYRGENHLIDDELAILLQAIRLKAASEGELFVAFDACYSRGLERGGEDEFPEDFDIDLLPEYTRGTDNLFSPSDKSYLKSLPLPPAFTTGCLMAIVSACADNERNFEVKIGNRYYGSLSYCISLLLKKNADFNDWINYFQSGKYQNSGCFTPFQHPSIKIYK